MSVMQIFSDARAMVFCIAFSVAGSVIDDASAMQVSERAGSNVDRREEDPGLASSLRSGDFSVEASAGLEYDSNVAVLDIDITSNQSDFAALFDLDLGYETSLGARTGIEVGYAFGQDLQFEQTQFNTQLHRGKLAIDHDFGDIKAGATYQLIYSRLGGDGFLRFHRFEPFVAGYAANKKLYLRASYIYTDKNFIGRTDRDGDVHAGSLDAFYFLDGVRSYLILGYRFEQENTNAPEFDFNGHNIKARLIQRVSIAGKQAKARLAWDYENRDYEAITPSIGAIRDDERNRFSASIEIPLTDQLYVELEGRYDIFNSNLPSVDFNQGVGTIRFGGRF